MPQKATPTEPTDHAPPRSLSMHDGVQTWCDCCSCEAEPRWQEVEQELERERQAEAAP